MNYQDYLRSPAWKGLARAARYRAGHRCEMCGGEPDHVHHVKYPKKLGQEHPDYLVVLCERCHKLSHGIRAMNQIIKVNKKILITLPFLMDGENEILVFIDDKGALWFTEKAITQVLAQGNYAFRRSFMAEAMLIIPGEDKAMAEFEGHTYNVISEPGFYEAMFWCKSQPGFENTVVKQAIRKMTKEVMPSLRKFGCYPPPDKVDPVEGSLEVVSRLLDAMKELRRDQLLTHKTVSNHDERIERLEEAENVFVEKAKVICSDGFMTAVAYLNQRGNPYGFDAPEFGTRVSRYCRAKAIHLPKVPHPRYGEINSYPIYALDAVYYLETKDRSPDLFN